jgi:hypothetical protein
VFGYGLGDRAIEALLGIKDKVKEIEWLIMALYKKIFCKVSKTWVTILNSLNQS